MRGTDGLANTREDASEALRTAALSAPGKPIAGRQKGASRGADAGVRDRVERNEARALARADRTADLDEAAAIAERAAFMRGLAAQLRAGSPGHPPPRRTAKTSRPMEASR